MKPPNPVLNEAAELLQDAHGTITGPRATDYGDQRRSFQTIADFWSTYLVARDKFHPTMKLTPEDVGMMLGLMKTSRIATGKYHRDNYLDMAGYAALTAGLAAPIQSPEGIKPPEPGEVPQEGEPLGHPGP